MTTKESTNMFVPNLEKFPQFEVPLVKYIFCEEKKKKKRKSLSSRAGSKLRLAWNDFIFRQNIDLAPTKLRQLDDNA